MSEDRAPGQLDLSDVKDGTSEVVRRIQAYLDELRKRREPLPANSEEWDRFFRVHASLFWRLVQGRHWSTEDCEDGVQELWLLFITRLPELCYDPRFGELDGWISVVAKNRLVDQDRYRGNHSMKHLNDQAANQLASRELDPAMAFEQNHVIELVRDALVELRRRVTPRDYEAFTLHWVEGLSVREVAQRLGRTEAEIWSSDHRLSQKLRPMLEQRLVQGPYVFGYLQ